MKRNQAGFTLIELIIVIVILGILAVTAAPKFLDFGGDARRSTLTGVKGALESASSIVYGKAIIAGQQAAALSCFTGTTVVAAPVAATTCTTGTDVVYGYPAASEASLRAAAELATAEWAITGTGPALITPAGYTPTTAGTCQVSYTAATATAKPAIVVTGTGC
ncbi:prepilin-type N-terminal cleavage/methylation domain-containing protein [Arsukibacterium sp.]|uniref:prepilin-type N-terminal cleavage/methylation domain-containing protein n=1 Tax=Arsukibacterium sp. TaxID=1977258 RepID=UPI00299CF46A|nr:prepilin-type N-terminal cleavage/methylation domain-containing protein [Arsukibacterium sp.]MDX1539564.1 prepilin-type N-terminal cleavage/methylation domain-containing protein [Arsukibacterium sp.]